jgi:BirA family transcriptional regulator, biotin operon repressor / biotin---[acetyl-CoA-carboxylase] ligase
LKASIIRLPETESTNTYAVQLLSQQRPENGCVIITDHQTKGKGQDINSWESEKGKNLTFSIILYPGFTADQQFVFNKAISLGICDFLKTELPEHTITIKWPNDIYIGNKKACGILIKNSVIGNKLDYVVVGIGLNVNQTVFKSDAPNPVSLQMITGMEYDLDIVLEKLLKCIFERYSQVKPESKQIIENEYHKVLYRLMEWHEYLVKNDKVIARITCTNEYGQLLLETETGDVLVCDLKEVKFIF